MNFAVETLSLPDVRLIRPRRFEDDRGYFSETYNGRALAEFGIDAVFVQDNQSLSRREGTVRGLHYQSPPHAQAKLVRVLAGAVIDVAVDARRGSPHFGKWASARLSAEGGEQMFVPRGFLHGFLTLEPDTVIAYKVDGYYHGGADGSVRWNDPSLGIDWGIDESEATLSQKDADAPFWAEFESPF